MKIQVLFPDGYNFFTLAIKISEVPLMGNFIYLSAKKL